MPSERPPIKMVRRGAFLAPCSPFDAESLEMLPAGKELAVRTSLARSVPALRFYWAMLKLVCDNLDQPTRPDTLHQWLKLKLGFTEKLKLRSGEIVDLPSSVAFDKMDEETFRDYLEAAKQLIVTQIIPRMDSKALEREAQAMLGGS